MQELLPAGSLYQGLAYSYMLNYMSFNLVGKTVEQRGRLSSSLKIIYLRQSYLKAVRFVFISKLQLQNFLS